MKEVVKEAKITPDDQKIVDNVATALEKCEYLCLWHYKGAVEDHGEGTKSVIYHIDVSDELDLPTAIAGMLIRDQGLADTVAQVYMRMRILDSALAEAKKHAN